MDSLGEGFIKVVERFQDRVAFEKHGTLTYGQLGERVKRLAYFLSTAGVKKQDRVAIIVENRPEWGVAFFALSYIGAVAVPVDSELPDKDIKNILSDSGARVVFISSENKRLQGIEDIEKIIEVEDIEKLPPAPEFERVDVAPDDLMVILYTSGTTDLPKGVMLTHKNLCSNFYSLNRFKLFSHRDVVLSVLPLYHSYPLMTTLIVPILSGAKVVYAGHDWPERLADYLRETRASIFIGVPQVFQMMHGRIMKKLEGLPVLARLYVKLAMSFRLSSVLLPKLRNAFGKDLRFFACGGAKLDKTVTRDFLRLGLKILEGYGLTETSPVVSFNPIRRPRPGSVGKALPDVKVRIVGKDGGGVGEIVIQGPNVMKGYYKDEDRTRMVIRDGWFFSGDLGYMDRDGYIYITGRSKEVIVLSSGKNIYPDEVEKHYSSSPYVKEMCALGVTKARGKTKIEYLHAVVVPDLLFFKERGEMNVRGVIKNTFENLSRDLPAHKHITGFTVSGESLPRTVLGKIKRYEVEKRFMPRIMDEERDREDATPEEKTLSESDTAKRLIDCIKKAFEIETPVRLSDSIELDLGVDSLGRVELVLALEKCFDIDFPEEMVAGEIFTVKDLVLKIEELIRQKGEGSAGMYQGEMGRAEDRVVSWPDIIRQPLSHAFQKKILLHAGWFDYILTFLVKGPISLFFRIFYNLKVEGAERIPKKGPYVLCVNHTSFLDGFIVLAGVPFRVELSLFFIAFRRYFIVPIVRNLVRRARIIPVDASEIIEAMQASSFILQHNLGLCIFPEGERSIDGKIKEFRKGVGIIAKELDVALAPVFIKGAFEAWPRAQRFPGLHPVEIKFGDPVSSSVLLKRGMALGAGDEYEAISMGIREELLNLSKTS